MKFLKNKLFTLERKTNKQKNKLPVTAIFHKVSVDGYFEENILLEPEGEVDKEK